MGLDIGIISIRYLERPGGVAYEFQWELAAEASANGYMYGEGNNWGAFTQRQVLEMLDRFAEREALESDATAEVLAWVQSLPWDGWRDDLALDVPQESGDDFSPVWDVETDRDGGVIELHFNW